MRRDSGDRISIVLLGSAARKVRTDGSDIDLLLIGTERPRVPKGFPAFHIQAARVSEFLANLENGEDLESWCVRLGVLLYDGGHWDGIVMSKEAKQWPRWQLKVRHGVRRLFLAHNFLEMRDYEACSEEMVYALGHIGRALLLKAGIFPLSRPELAGQLQTLGYSHLAILHEKLRRNEGAPQLLNQARFYSKKLLCHLDRAIYGAYATEHKRKATLKKAKS